MAKSIYLGNGKAIKIKKIYEGNGVARKIKKGYVGDSSGVARLFFTSGYRWERYTVTYTTSEQTLISADGSYPAPILAFITYPPYYKANPSGTAGAINAGVSSYQVIIGTWNGSSVTGRTTTISKGGYVYSGNNYMQFPTFGNIIIHVTNGCRLNATGISGGGTHCYMYGNGYVTEFKLVRRTGNKGSYVDTVESDNINQYPNNGISGGYWYVKIAS